MRQKYYKKRKLQTSIIHEHRRKNQQKIYKLNPAGNKKIYESKLSDIYPRYAGSFRLQKSIDVIHHVTRLKKKNHMIIAIDA